MDVADHGLYLIKDEYFSTFPSANWMWNKRETRPHYLSVRDAQGFLWMIPMSSKVESLQEKIAKVEEKRGKGKCLYYHIGLVAGVERGFIISGMFPITKQYIAHEYEYHGKAYIIENQDLNAAIYSKAMSYLRLLEQHKMRDSNNVLHIRQVLKGTSSSNQ